MKKILLIVAATLLTSVSAMAQTTLKLTYFKDKGMTDDKWESWPKDWQDTYKTNGFLTTMSIQKIDDEIFTIEFDYGGSAKGMFKDNVIYDAVRTAEVRKANSNQNFTAYRFSGSKDYLWTKNVTLAELYSAPSKWTTAANAEIYTWQHSLGSATVYTTQLPAQPAKKYTVHFSSTMKKIKGIWADWSDWGAVAQNSYFELKVVTEKSVFNFIYYENGKLVRNYNITYDDQMTKRQRVELKNEKLSCYKVIGSNNDWVYLMNTSMTGLFGNPDKWSENNAEIYIMDAEKTGFVTRLK